MNHQFTRIAVYRAARVVATLCAVYFCGSTAFAERAKNWPRLYNDGVTAYQSNDFAHAAAGFENATASKDRALQQRALYNLGNASYRLGQTQPAQAQQAWQHAIQDYESALALDPQDSDAKFNHDFVKKKLEELKKQQQQQDQKKQQDKKQEQNKDEQKQQPKPDQQQQNSKDEQSEQQKQQQSQQSEEEKKQAQEQKDKEREQQTQQEKSTQPEQKSQPENYDKMQATALLNDLRENEQNWNFFPEVQMKDLKDSGPPAKDW